MTSFLAGRVYEQHQVPAAAAASTNLINVSSTTQQIDTDCYDQTNDTFLSFDPLRPATSCSNITAARPTSPDCGDGPIPLPIAVLGATLGSVILATGIFGNVLILASIWRYRPLRKTANAFVASLALCDLFHTVLVRPLYIHTYIVGRWQFSASTCAYALVASNIAILESILHVTTIALHRYFALVKPRCCSSCLQSRAAVGVLLAVIYAVPLIGLFWFKRNQLFGGVEFGRDVVFNRRLMFCSVVRHSEFRPASAIQKAAFVAGSAAVIGFCYYSIYRLVRSRGRRLSIHGAFNPVRIQRELTLLKSIVAVFGTFIVCYMPITVIYGIDVNRSFTYSVYLVGVILLWIAPSANWAIYGRMNAQFNRAYRQLLRRSGRRRLQSFSGGGRLGSLAGGINGACGQGTPSSRRSVQLVWPPCLLDDTGGRRRMASDAGQAAGGRSRTRQRQMSLWSSATTNGPTNSDDVDEVDSHRMTRFGRNISKTSSSSSSFRRPTGAASQRCCSVVEFSPAADAACCTLSK